MNAAPTRDEINVGVRRVLDHAPEGCFMTGPDGGYEFVNRTWCELTGVGADDALDMGWLATVHREDLVRVTQNWRDAAMRGAEFAMEFRVDVGGIVPRWLAVTANPVFDAAGATAGFLGWVTDVTKKVELEKYLERALMDQVKVSEQSRRQEERFRLIIENTSEGIWQLDANHRTVFCNERLAEMIGCEVVDLIGRSLGDIVSNDAVIDARLRTKGPGDRTLQEVNLRHVNGNGITVMLAAAALGHEGRTYDGSLVIVSDLSDLRETEHRLHTIEQQFQTVFERAPIGISIVGVDGHMVEVNEALAAMAGYEREELVGKHSFLLVSEHDRERAATVVSGLLEADGPHATMEYRMHVKGGVERWVRSDTSIVHDDEGAVLYRVTLTTDITEKRRFEEHLVHEASHDHLTGIPNRALLRELLEQAAARTQRHDGTMAVMFVDLDHFKAVNDGMGHAAGDEVLVEAARRITVALRVGDVVARYGGDEFVVVCEDAGSEDDALEIADRLRTSLTQPFVVEGGEARIGASIGIVLSDGTDDIDRLLDHADQGLYRAKRDGRGRSVIAEVAEQLAG